MFYPYVENDGMLDGDNDRKNEPPLDELAWRRPVYQITK
jgi:hypothetical protein